jgi:hypothetical protein
VSVELIRADRVLNVHTGEQLDLRAAPVDELAQAREGLTALRREIDDAAVMLDAEIVGRVDTAIRAGEISQYSVQVGGFEIKVPSPEAGGKVDAAALREELLGRVTGHTLDLTRDAVLLAFKSKTTYTLDRSAYNTLAKQEPELHELLKRHTGPPERRRATVTLLPGTGREGAVTVVAAEDAGQEEEEFPW